jgi:hypothetical protein
MYVLVDLADVVKQCRVMQRRFNEEIYGNSCFSIARPLKLATPAAADLMQISRREKLKKQRIEN